MRDVLLVTALAACGAPPPAPPALRPIENRAPAGEATLQFRKIEAGQIRGHATRTTFMLGLARDLATLDESDETLARSATLDQADRDTAWTAGPTHRYRGTRRDVGGAIELALSSPDAQPLALHCEWKLLEAAGPGAIRVASPDRGPDYECGDTGVWSPSATTPVKALVCTAAGQTADDSDDDDDRLVFAPAPGLEWVYENDDCSLQGGGLRRAAR